MKRKVIIVIGIAIIAIAGAFLAYRYFKMPVVQTKEFNGNLQSIKNNSIFVQGSPFSSDAKVIQSIKIDPNNPPTVEIVVTADTKIIRTTFYMPTADELKKTNGMFYPDKLPKEQSSVGLDMLLNDFKIAHYIIGIKVKGTTNVIGQPKFTAQQIEYTFPVQ